MAYAQTGNLTGNKALSARHTINGPNAAGTRKACRESTLTLRTAAARSNGNAAPKHPGLLGALTAVIFGYCLSVNSQRINTPVPPNPAVEPLAVSFLNSFFWSIFDVLRIVRFRSQHQQSCKGYPKPDSD